MFQSINNFVMHSYHWHHRRMSQLICVIFFIRTPHNKQMKRIHFHQKPFKCWHQKGNPKGSRVTLALDYPFTIRSYQAVSLPQHTCNKQIDEQFKIILGYMHNIQFVTT